VLFSVLMMAVLMNQEKIKMDSSVFHASRYFFFPEDQDFEVFTTFRKLRESIQYICSWVKDAMQKAHREKRLPCTS
jgi:hypothetical protein